MWLGMLAAVVGQVPASRSSRFTARSLAARRYIAQVAPGAPGRAGRSWASRWPAWPRLGGGVRRSWRGDVAAGAWARRRRDGRVRPRPPSPPGGPGGRGLRRAGVPIAARSRPGRPPGLRVVVLERRAGRLDPARARRRRRRCWWTAGRRATTSPPAERRRASTASRPRSPPTTSPTTSAGSTSCSARFPVHRLRLRELGRRLLGARAGRTPPALPGRRGRRAALGRPAPRCPLATAGAARRSRTRADPNQLAVVILARWRDFSMLLTADAEAEAVPLDPGPVDVLKVAHHGVDDAGLGALLDRNGAAARGDLGRRGQPLRPPDRGRPWRPWPRTASRPCARTRTATSTIDVSARGWRVESG